MLKHNEFAFEAVALPTGERVEVASLCRFDDAQPWNTCGDVMYLQRVRRGDESLRESYEANEARYVSIFALHVGGRFDAIVSPPSKYTFAVPYRRRFAERLGVPDLTPFIHRRQDAKEAGGGASVEDVVSGLTVDPLPLLRMPAALLVVDDIYEEGKTVAALLHVLRAADVEIGRVVVAAPLRIVATAA
jgi:hypothetical protein